MKALNFDGKPCGYCGAKTRRQRKPKWFICQNGHSIQRKSK